MISCGTVLLEFVELEELEFDDVLLEVDLDDEQPDSINPNKITETIIPINHNFFNLIPPILIFKIINVYWDQECPLRHPLQH